MDGFIPKPIDIKKLSQVLSQWHQAGLTETAELAPLSCVAGEKQTQ
jgi:hypothetical protein